MAAEFSLDLLRSVEDLRSKNLKNGVATDVTVTHLRWPTL